ncbi:MAG: PH domain-containing protein [Thermomicrobiales bacterium]|nr:PH domain-containing protein [Thermomicrobiales bacterium]
MVDFDDQTISFGMQRTELPPPDHLAGWIVRRPSPQARRWSVARGLVYGLVWAFPFVTAALLWRRIAGSDADTVGPTILTAAGVVLSIVWLIVGIFAPRFWWFAYTANELIIEHGLLFRRRDHLAFDRVQYLTRRAGPLMRSMGVATLVFDTAAGRATVPAALADDISIVEAHVRAAMQRAAVI